MAKNFVPFAFVNRYKPPQFEKSKHAEA